MRYRRARRIRRDTAADKHLGDNVSWQQVPGAAIADIRLASFSSGVSRDLEAILATVAERKLTGAVLDLRNNPGGELDEAIEVASQFLRGGDVLLEKDRRGATQHDKVQPRMALHRPSPWWFSSMTGRQAPRRSLRAPSRTHGEPG